MPPRIGDPDAQHREITGFHQTDTNQLGVKTAFRQHPTFPVEGIGLTRYPDATSAKYAGEVRARIQSHRQDGNDLGSLHLLARCQLRRGNLQALPAILDTIRAKPDSEAVGTAVEIEYHEPRGHVLGHVLLSSAEVSVSELDAEL